jgi:hypothetical protein
MFRLPIFQAKQNKILDQVNEQQFFKTFNNIEFE